MNDDDLNPQYCSRCHKHVPKAELSLHKGICYNCSEDVKNIKARQVHEVQANTIDNNKCIVCGFILLPDETICPWCENPQKADSHAIWIDIHNLRPIEALICKDMSKPKIPGVQSKKTTDVQLLEMISNASLDIEKHPVFSMVMNCPDRNNHIICNHSSHNTEEKTDRCLRQQAAKMTVRTIRHNLGFLERYVLWSEPRSMILYAMWACYEKTKQACNKCRQREGIIKPPSGQRRVAVIHPGCNCGLTQLFSHNIYQSINKLLDYLEGRSPERASRVSTNLIRCGFHPRRSMQAGSKDTSCCLFVLIVPVLIIILTVIYLVAIT